MVCELYLRKAEKNKRTWLAGWLAGWLASRPDVRPAGVLCVFVGAEILGGPVLPAIWMCRDFEPHGEEHPGLHHKGWPAPSLPGAPRALTGGRAGCARDPLVDEETSL